MSAEIRRVAADDWIKVRALRLRALQDPVSALAFLDTFESASRQPDDFWQQRTVNAAEGGPNAQYVAIAADGEWFGSATVIPSQISGGDGTALVVGVYIAEGHRGRGAIEALFDECAVWAAEQGYPELTLEVHVDNGRAQSAYERCGFTRTGQITRLPNGYEYVMTRPVVPDMR